MLVLSRRIGQKVLAGNVEVTVTAVKGDRVWLGFVAPPEVPVHRAEVAAAIAAEREGDGK